MQDVIYCFINGLALHHQSPCCTVELHNDFHDVGQHLLLCFCFEKGFIFHRVLTGPYPNLAASVDFDHAGSDSHHAVVGGQSPESFEDRKWKSDRDPIRL